MKARVTRSLRRVDRERMNVKLSRGCICEIEFVAQVLQLIYAGKDPRVLERNTLRALDRLSEGTYLTAADRDVLAHAYQFPRQVEHKIPVVQDRPTHALTGTEEEILPLARRLFMNGVNERIGGDFQDPLAVFVTMLQKHSSVVHQICGLLFHVPEENPERQGAEENAATEALLQELRKHLTFDVFPSSQ